MSTTMTIRQMCDHYDVTPRTLRFYEQKELLSPIREGTRRLFTKRDRARLKLILRGKRFGISLEEIRRLLDVYEQGGEAAQIEKTYEVAKARLDEMQQERDELDAAIDELKGQIRWGEEMLATQRRTNAA